MLWGKVQNGRQEIRTSQVRSGGIANGRWSQTIPEAETWWQRRQVCEMEPGSLQSGYTLYTYGVLSSLPLLALQILSTNPTRSGLLSVLLRIMLRKEQVLNKYQWTE